MRKLLSSVLTMFFVLFSVFLVAQSTGTPPPPPTMSSRPGDCYKLVYEEPIYTKDCEEVIIKPAYTKHETVDAVFVPGTRQIVAKEEVWEWKMVNNEMCYVKISNAEIDELTIWKCVTPAQVKEVYVPAETEQVCVDVMTHEGRYVWKSDCN